jgi:hypothetical protein
MAFRAEDPVIVQAFNDLGFFLFPYTWPPFGIPGHHRHRGFPRRQPEPQPINVRVTRG